MRYGKRKDLPNNVLFPASTLPTPRESEENTLDEGTSDSNLQRYTGIRLLPHHYNRYPVTTMVSFLVNQTTVALECVADSNESIIGRYQILLSEFHACTLL
jgi:hypothetical protein